MPFPKPLTGSIALFGVAFAAACGGSEAAQLPPPNVTIVTTAPADIPASIELVGQGAASKFIEVRSQLNGVIVARPYREGSDVDKGELLFQLDPTVYEATYRSAKAAAENARARLDNAQRTLTRVAHTRHTGQPRERPSTAGERAAAPVTDNHDDDNDAADAAADAAAAANENDDDDDAY